MLWDKKFNAYMTLEASFIFPMVIFIYYLMIIASLTLFMRCYNSQINFIKDFYIARYNSYEEEDVMEVIYGNFNDTGIINGGVYRINPLVINNRG